MTDPTDIFAWRRFDARLTTSGQPGEAQLVALQALGISHVVNLALHDHPQALPDEARSLAALGLGYTHIPVPFDAPDEDQLRRFGATLDALAGKTVHVHCIANLRVTAFLERHYAARGRDVAEFRETVWRPGGVWAVFIGNAADAQAPHRYAGRDY